MKAVIQRVSCSNVKVDNEIKGAIGKGILVLLGVENGDDEQECDLLAKKIAVLRIFSDENDKMNLSLGDIDGEVLVISNFTLCGDCRKGRRPFFGQAGNPELAEKLYERFCEKLKEQSVRKVEKGVFGADMEVKILNDGPVTIILDSKELPHK